MEYCNLVDIFIDYITDEDHEKYDRRLPFGGILDDAPPNAKKAYEEYLLREIENQKEGIKV
ncbi:MAG: hypothetical protein MJ172_12005 [Clostridia bacterium]|nr:hypothetical protein [Clostridia bacterium]